MKTRTTRAAILGVAVVLAAIPTAPLRAQSFRLPDTYSFLSTNSWVGPQMTVKVNRNGSKELIERTVVPQSGASSQYHDRVLYDFEAHRIYTLDLTSNICSTQQYASAYAPSQLDPIGGAAEMQSQLAANPPKKMAADTVNGIAANVVTLESSEMPGKIWLDAKHGFIVKLVLAVGGGPETTAFEMRQLSYQPSPASLFTAPSGCTQIGGVSDANGGHAELSVDANVQAQEKLSGVPKPGPRLPAAGGPDPLMGKWEFTGKDSAGTAWSGTLTIGELDTSAYDTNPPPFSHMCDIELAAGNAGRGSSGPCLFDGKNKTLSIKAGDSDEYTAVLSPDGASLTKGRWVQGGSKNGTWSARSSKAGARTPAQP